MTRGKRILISNFLMTLHYCPGTRFSEGDGSSNEVQRTMLELINQLDGFDPRGNIKVLMATNRLVYVFVNSLCDQRSLCSLDSTRVVVLSLLG